VLLLASLAARSARVVEERHVLPEYRPKGTHAGAVYKCLRAVRQAEALPTPGDEGYKSKHQVHKGPEVHLGAERGVLKGR